MKLNILGNVRRGFFVLTAYFCISCSSMANNSAMGVNVNGLGDQLQNTSGSGMLQRSGTKWVRMFVDMSKLRGKSQNEIDDDESLANFRNLHSKGYHTILNLKWATNGRDFPAAGTQERLDDFDVMRKVISAAGKSNVDIVVVGNEPFRETDHSFRDQDMTDWYIRMTNEINNYRNNNNLNFEIYMGSFNNVHFEHERTQVLLDLMAFARSKNWISGIDLHMHHTLIEEWQDALDFSLGQIRNNQNIIVTEFSLMRWYKSHNTDDLASSYKNKYYPTGTSKKVWQELVVLQDENYTQRWYDFNDMHDFVSSRKHYLRNLHLDYLDLPNNKIRLAMFALRQNSFANYSSNKDAWIYNGLFCYSTCNGEDESYNWLNDFIELPKE